MTSRARSRSLAVRPLPPPLAPLAQSQPQYPPSGPGPALPGPCVSSVGRLPSRCITAGRGERGGGRVRGDEEGGLARMRGEGSVCELGLGESRCEEDSPAARRSTRGCCTQAQVVLDRHEGRATLPDSPNLAALRLPCFQTPGRAHSRAHSGRHAAKACTASAGVQRQVKQGLTAWGTRDTRQQQAAGGGGPGDEGD